MGAAASLELLTGLDMSSVHAHNTSLADAPLERLELPPHGSAIVTLDADEDVIERLMRAGVQTALRRPPSSAAEMRCSYGSNGLEVYRMQEQDSSNRSARNSAAPSC